MKENRTKEENKEQPKASRKEGQAKLPRALIGVLNGSFLTREQVLGNMPFILYVAGLMLLYIGYGYYTERTVRDLHGTDGDLKELRSEYITVRSHLDKTEQQSQVAEGISGIGLRESRVPPRKIEVDEDHLEDLR